MISQSMRRTRGHEDEDVAALERRLHHVVLPAAEGGVPCAVGVQVGGRKARIYPSIHPFIHPSIEHSDACVHARAKVRGYTPKMR